MRTEEFLLGSTGGWGARMSDYVRRGRNRWCVVRRMAKVMKIGMGTLESKGSLLSAGHWLLMQDRMKTKQIPATDWKNLTVAHHFSIDFIYFAQD